MPATIDTSTALMGWAVLYSYSRMAFFAAGRFWAFYLNGTNAVYESTTKHVDWSGSVTVIGPCIEGTKFSIFFDGTYVHYVRDYFRDLFYRRGTPNADGSITWSADEQMVYDGDPLADYYLYPCISVDSGGYAWIGAQYYDGDRRPYVLKNANNDGTWTTDFAYQLNVISDQYWRVCPIPLTSAKVYVIYCRLSQLPLGKLYDAGWGGEENDLADYNIEVGYFFSAVAKGDNVEFVYNRDATNQIRYNKRTFGVGWGANDILVQDAVTGDCSPALSIDTVNNELYCFWTSTVTDHVYYKKFSSGVWGYLVDWIDESTDDISADYIPSSYYQDYGGYIALLYVTKLASPYTVRFSLVHVPPLYLQNIDLELPAGHNIDLELAVGNR